MENKDLFYYDQLIPKEHFCNFEKEKKIIQRAIENNECIKLYGPRNFGKTSLARNIIAKDWESINPVKRVILYADFYSVTSLEDLSQEFTQSFNLAITSKQSILEKSFDWLKVLTKVRPVWVPSLTSDSGEFSITTENAERIVDFRIILENIHELQKNSKFEFLIILDEFQEIHQVKRAEALLRGALQSFSIRIPIIILGSKQHLLISIFENPKAPFYSWGRTVEFHPIAYEIYHQYIEERFLHVKKTHSLQVSEYLQNKLHRIPESINRLCDYLAKNESEHEITKEIIDRNIEEFVDQSRSIYEQLYSTFNTTERRIVEVISQKEFTTELLGKKFIAEVGNISKTTLSNHISQLLNRSILSQGITDESKKSYWVTDPLFSYFLKRFKR